MSESTRQTRPIISVALQPKTDDDRQHLQQALSDIALHDATISVRTEPEGGKIILSGMDEFHLNLVRVQILRKHKIQVEVSEPQVIYLETIRNLAEAEGKYIRQTGGCGNYGHVKIRLEPNKPGKGYEFVESIKGSVIPKEYIEPTEQGIREASKNGVLAGYEMVDFKATLYDGSCHDIDSNEMAFKIAGAMAFEEAARKASPVILEPLMSVEVDTPTYFAAKLIDDLNSRRGIIQNIESYPDSKVIDAIVPLAEILGYTTYLRTITQDEARCSMRFSHYEELDFGEWRGDYEAGVVANKPKGPRGRSGSVAADPESD